MNGGGRMNQQEATTSTEISQRIENILNVKEYRPKVLIVEDDLDMVDIVEKILISINPTTEISWASSAEEAHFRLHSQKIHNWDSPYDLIIADIFLEGEETGLDLFRKCQGLYPDIPFIATSSTSIDKFYSKYGFSKIPLFLAKPVQYSEWKSILQDLL
jgi:response regulator of citrate/malate metabolism